MLFTKGIECVADECNQVNVCIYYTTLWYTVDGVNITVIIAPVCQPSKSVTHLMTRLDVRSCSRHCFVPFSEERCIFMRVGDITGLLSM